MSFRALDNLIWVWTNSTLRIQLIHIHLPNTNTKPISSDYSNITSQRKLSWPRRSTISPQKKETQLDLETTELAWSLGLNAFRRWPDATPRKFWFLWENTWDYLIISYITVNQWQKKTHIILKIIIAIDIWLVVFRHPSETCESQLGWWETQLDGKTKRWSPRTRMLTRMIRNPGMKIMREEKGSVKCKA